MPIQFYKQGTSDVREDLFSMEAEKIASGWGQGREGVSKSQMRKIFDEVKTLQRRASVQKWEEILPLIKMLKSKVTYQVTRAVEKDRQNKVYYDKFKQFILDGVDAVSTPRDFEVFCLLFEAAYGFYYARVERK